jgi:hypothetical protein
MAPAGFETAIPASERPQTHALDRAATWGRESDQLVSNILQQWKTLFWLENFTISYENSEEAKKKTHKTVI